MLSNYIISFYFEIIINFKKISENALAIKKQKDHLVQVISKY